MRGCKRLTNKFLFDEIRFPVFRNYLNKKDRGNSFYPAGILH